MKLSGLLDEFEITLLKGDLDINIKNIINDSRSVEEGSLFICIDGFETDGHKYIESAIKKGAKAILVQKKVEVEEDITVVQVEDTRKALALLSSKYYNHPSNKFELIGITGTNGKTSTVFLIKNILESFKKKTGIIGTIENRIGDEVFETSRTTPESNELQELFSKMAEANVNDVIMEVSSHALDLHRVDGSMFDIGVFTNLSLDHLEYHKTMENYRDAKLKLLNMCPIGVINIDDTVGVYMVENSNCKKYITYGCDNDKASLNASKISNKISGTSFYLTLNGEEHLFEIQTPGKFSVYNALAAIGVCIALNVPVEIIKKSLKEKSTIKGRFETFISKEGFFVIVDYAHTPDGLENVLDTILEVSLGRVITVFGCGGDRDRSKRPKMGKIVGEKSDYSIITSDNPRTENPELIMKEIEEGINTTDCFYEIIESRELAIENALSIAKKDDIVLIAGKGHEDYQIIGTTKNYFDDAELVKKILSKK
ncbi:MAG: UDP-N-acetylmuramoyl-L-alanyl-D-glutamate--2,6-diaminopimelate ligase [Firmicutes bacterium HGW-Firmicutes-1]|jgi:UDP-N-acetylmuramoyl-L-alanyl-D-glutamate--2,6-diaminopimelate ligase|nr:MAG: UDP-N-acetylmuramoyl-L-alanyl-D-glutamate--2,6-diaminopimelate ligase [Firmicutes bacterium HGW-Firmicutes-1]